MSGRLTSSYRFGIVTVCTSSDLGSRAAFPALHNDDSLLFRSVSHIPYPDSGIVRRRDKFTRVARMPTTSRDICYMTSISECRISLVVTDPRLLSAHLVCRMS
jgi:hypothetical protein